MEGAYRHILERAPDEDGFRYYANLLRDGLDRTAVLLALTRSDEFVSRLKPTTLPLPDLRNLRPERYAEAVDLTNNQTILVFDVADPSDFDWLEAAITQNRYYENPGVWNFGIDVDKRLMAEIASCFGPERPIEFGCASGAVLECLLELDIVGEGIEISAMAVSLASDRVRAQIHVGDLPTLELPQSYDLIMGLDIFEHLNPNRIGAYVKRLAEIATSPAYVFCNIPAFGADPIFGTVFPLYLKGWAEEAARGHNFSRLHADALGYPLHGHLISADSAWWVRCFEAAGFRREMELEQELHHKYDEYMNTRSVARKAYFVFSKGETAERNRRVINRIREPSKVLR